MNDFSFSFSFYIGEYNDLKKNGICTEIDAIRHYQNYGKYEGRFKSEEEKKEILSSIDIFFFIDNYGLEIDNLSVTTTFCPNFYGNEYKDLHKAGLKKEEFLSHFLCFGKNEGRCPNETYKVMIQTYTEEEIKKRIYFLHINNKYKFLSSKFKDNIKFSFSSTFYEKEYGGNIDDYINYGRFNGDLICEEEKKVVKINDELDFGFIILSHINSDETRHYILESYTCIRRLYGKEKKIVIIYDNCDIPTSPVLENVIEIESEFPGRGELLPYYYLYKYRFFSIAIIIHDSTFLKKKIIESLDIKKIKYLWHFDTEYWGKDEREKELILHLKNNEKLLSLWDERHLYKSCFGVQSIITYDFLHEIQMNYNIFILLNYIFTRYDRCLLERIFALICYSLSEDQSSIFGNIHEHQKWLYSYNEYMRDREKNILPIVKVFTGR
jgi:hypothetical protein